MITYLEAKKILAKYQGVAGSCIDDPNIDTFVRQVLEYLLYQGTHGNIRKFCFQAQNGCFTLPKELEVPLKIRIDGAVGTVWNQWFEYHSGNDIDNECLASNAVTEEPNRYPTAFDGPYGGFYVGIRGWCDEDCNAHVIVKGVDVTGKEIFTVHKGEPMVGEYITIEKGILKTGNVLFGRITEVAKTVTEGYCTLFWVDEPKLRTGFLADYDPYETNPSYRRIKILTPDCPPICTVSVLGRIKLKDYYADEDLIPFDNRFLLTVAGQTVNSMFNGDVQAAAAKEGYVAKLIETEGNYKKVNNGAPVEVYRPLSGGACVDARRKFRRFGLRGFRL